MANNENEVTGKKEREPEAWHVVAIAGNAILGVALLAPEKKLSSMASDKHLKAKLERLS